MPAASLAVVFVSNGPGELATWVRPLAKNLHKRILMRPLAENSEISFRLLLVPCPNATGNESIVAGKWDYFDEIYSSKSFWNLLISPNKYSYWPRKGLVVFLGGDQFWSVLLSARLGYRHLTYAEWVARWPFWNDRIAAMSKKVKDQIPSRFRNRCTVVGDLMADISAHAKSISPLPKGEWVALLPGSKRAKLSVGVPFLFEVADRLAEIRPGCKFLLPVAPTTSIEEIQSFYSSDNRIADLYESVVVSIRESTTDYPWLRLITKRGAEINIHENYPAHEFLSQCNLALTTVGANTAELGALNVPMIVIVPTQHLFVMQAWDGLIGLIGRLPFLRYFIGFFLSAWKLRNRGYLAWPNISAGRMIVPERVGPITPKEIASEASDWLAAPERLKGQKDDLSCLRGSSGAINALVNEVCDLIQ